MNFKEYSINTLKGFSMGAGVFPGVSAGTVALMTGIFRPLIASLSAIMSLENWKLLFKGDAKGFWEAINGEFLLPCVIGMVLGFLVLARLVGWALSYWPVPTWAFFFGLILVSTIWLLTDFKDWTWRDALPLAIGVGIGVALCLVQQPDQNHPNTALWYTGLSGALAVCSMILPGIAGSFILVMMGNFTFMLEVLNGTVSHLLGGDGVAQWGQLLVFMLGCVLGIVAFSKALNALLEKHGRPTMLVLFGFVLGFLVAIWPWADMASIEAAQLLRTGSASPVDLQIPLALFAFIIGGAAVAAIEIPSKKNA
ncbi:MAG: DUF368 domain-containing protein [Bacteroidales bacterium]|nr:DUF368 domain-containing protein [Bacteroidales bacterium]